MNKLTCNALRLAVVWLASTVVVMAQVTDNLLKDVVMTEGLLVGGKHNALYEKTYKYTPAIAVVANARYIISQGVDYQGSEYDAAMTFIRDIRMKHDAKNVVYVASPRAAFVRLNLNNNDNGRFMMQESAFTKSCNPPAGPQADSQTGSRVTPDNTRTAPARVVGGLSQWAGKRIAWYGTSIPAGYPHQGNQAVWSYANKAVEAVGATIQNYGVPNGVIRESKSDGSSLGASRDSLSFLRLTSAVNYQKSMLALVGTASEPDLFVFDYGVNDADSDVSEFARFDPLDPCNSRKAPDQTSIASRDTKTYIGAQNWVIDQLLKAKPNARVAFVTHFSRDAFNEKSRWEKLIQVQTALGDYWGFPTCRVYEKTGWINRDGNNTVRTFNPDGIHPASARNTQSVDIMALIAADFLKGIF